MREEENQCEVCKIPSSNKCSGCKLASYCSKEHQKRDWPNHRNLCKPFKIVTSSTKGRCMVATRTLKAGEVLLQEPSFVVGPRVLNPSPLCVGCYSLLKEHFERCPKCHLPMCDSACRKSEHHLLECQYLEKHQILNKEDPFEDFEILVVLRILLKISQKTQLFQAFMNLQSNLSEKKISSDWKRIERTLIKLRTKYLTDQLCTSQELEVIFSILDSNAFQVFAPINLDSMCAIYLQSSMINHSCLPNARPVITKDFKFKVVLIDDVIEGEEILFSYVTPFLTYLQRQNLLSKGKYFICKCKRCIDPTENGSYSSAIACKVCNSGYVIPLNPERELTEWACENCHAELCGQKAIQLDVYLDNEKSKVKRTDMNNVKKFLKAYQGILHPNHCFIRLLRQYLCEGSQCDKNCKTKCEEKLQNCKLLLSAYEKTEAPYSVLKGIVYVEMAEVLIQLGGHDNQMESLDMLQKAKAIFRHEDPQSPEGAIVHKLQFLETLMK